jgi:hypothetical protein
MHEGLEEAKSHFHKGQARQWLDTRSVNDCVVGEMGGEPKHDHRQAPSEGHANNIHPLFGSTLPDEIDNLLGG